MGSTIIFLQQYTALVEFAVGVFSNSLPPLFLYVHTKQPVHDIGRAKHKKGIPRFSRHAVATLGPPVSIC